jgi:hypothetical protein
MKKTRLSRTRSAQGFPLGRVEVGVGAARLNFLAERLIFLTESWLCLEAAERSRFFGGRRSEVCNSGGYWVAGPGSEFCGIVDWEMVQFPFGCFRQPVGFPFTADGT